VSRWLADRRLVIALGRRHAAFAWPGAPVRNKELPSALVDLSMDLPGVRAALLREWLSEQARLLGVAQLPWEFVLTCDLSRVWALSLPSGIRSRAELIDLAQAHCVRTFGISARIWRIGADWRTTDSLACWAIPGWIKGLSGARAPRILAAEAIAVSRADLPRNGWVVLRFPQSAALLRLERGGVRKLRTIALVADAGESQDRIDIEMRREMLRAGSDSQAGFLTVDVRRRDPSADTDATLAASLASNREGVGRDIPIWEPTRWSVLVGAASTRLRRLVMSVSLLISAGLLTWTTAAAVRETMLAKEEQERVDGKRAAAVTPNSSLTAVTALSRGERAKLNVAIRHLDLPWSGVLDSLEYQTPDGIVISSIQASGDRASLRLQVGGADMDTLVRYADALARTPMFMRADLVQQEGVAGSGSVFLTFDLALRQPPGETK